MGKCRSCGTGGLFFKLDKDGLCSYCAQLKREAEEEMMKRRRLEIAEADLKRVQDRHFKYLEEIKQYGGRAIQGKDKVLTNRIYGLCQNDVSLIPEYFERAKKYSEIWRELYNSKPPISNFDRAFETMAFIEQKRNNSEKSIELCMQAINNGGDVNRMESLIEVFKKPYKPRVIHEAYTEYWNI